MKQVGKAPVKNAQNFVRAPSCISISAILLFTIISSACAPLFETADPGAALSNQATSGLERFGLTNPKCEIWTNWQNVCSRTGLTDNVNCQEASNKVEASETFCVAVVGRPFEGLPVGSSKKQRASYNRFCVEFDDPGSSEAKCLRWNETRPFNGKRLEELSHPWCDRWALASDPSVNPDLSEKLGFYCASRGIPDWCEWEDGMGLGLQDNATQKERSNAVSIFFRPLNPATRVVNAPHCRRRK